LRYLQLTIIFIFFIEISFDSSNSRKSNFITTNTNKITTDNSKTTHNTELKNENLKTDTIDIIVVQCANGYEYVMHGYDFNPIIESELNKFDNINVKPFPYKTLLGVPYQEVFDKKYCTPIIEKVNVDFLVLTRFDKNYNELKQNQDNWGYEIRVVNTETFVQINSINGHNFDEYKQIEKHLKNNISTLKMDIKKLQ